MHLEMEDVDQFLVDNLKYWSSTYLSLIGRTLIVNKKLMSSMWYFIAIWVGLKRILGKIKALLCKYMWSGAENIARTQVSWDNYIMLKKIGGLS